MYTNKKENLKQRTLAFLVDMSMCILITVFADFFFLNKALNAFVSVVQKESDVSKLPRKYNCYLH